MDKNQQIVQWYSSLQQVSYDDKADFEVMLLDLDNPADASAAVTGIAINLMEKGMRNDLVSLLFVAARTENVKMVQLEAITHLISLYWFHDDEVRRDKDLQEWLLDLLADHPDEVPSYLYTLNTAKNRLSQLDNVKKLKDTLLYQVAVVGEEQQKRFRNI